MAKERIAMYRIEEILRLHHECGLSQREIGRSCGVSVSTVNRLLRQARQAALGWRLPEELDEGQLQERLYGGPPGSRRSERRKALDFAAVQSELKQRKHLTLQRLWREYREQERDGYSYSQYCLLYRQWKARQGLVMAQEHKAGDKLFVDYAGQTVPVEAAETGAERQAQVFVAVLGASSYCYAEASWGQDVESWIGSHVRALEYFGGAPRMLVPDNLKSAVTRACRYEPVLNRSYQEMARHYGISVVPARPYKPKDKAKVEQTVLWVERNILEALRHERFARLAELNAAMAKLLPELNARPFQKRPGSRRQLFEQLDRPALRALPTQRYEYAAWLKARVQMDYHVLVDGQRYSVPHSLVRQVVEVRLTEKGVEVLHEGRRVAVHARGRTAGGCTTEALHRPRSHREHAEWSADRVQDWAATVGPYTVQLVGKLLAGRFASERHGSCRGLMRLGRQCGLERLEAAARRALHFGALSYRSIQEILTSGVDRQPLDDATPTVVPIEHENVRGAEYYGQPASNGRPRQEEAGC